MFCPKCGQWNAGSATQCTACGTSLLPPDVANMPPTPQPSPNVTQPSAPSAPPATMLPPLYGPGANTPPAYPTAAPPQPPYPTYPSQGAPSYPSAPAQPVYPQAPQPVYPNYPQQSYPNAPAAQGNVPTAYPSYSPMPSYSPLPPGSPYAGPQPTYGSGYQTQMQRTLSQCKVCGSMIAYGTSSCTVCLVPLNMIANPYDPTVTTYLDARALNQPGTSPVYAAPGAYAGRVITPANTIPDELKKGWNWGASLNTTLWAFTHRAVGWGLLTAAGLFFWFMTIIALFGTSPADLHGSKSDSSDAILGMLFAVGMALVWVFKTIYLGLKGNEIAWRSGRYTSPARLQEVQKQWALWSILLFVVASAILFTATGIAASR